MSENNRKICELWWEGWSFGKKLALLAVLFTGLVQAERPCDADPRYLLVTVVAENIWFGNEETGKLEKRPDLSWTKPPRPVLLDRCDDVNFYNATSPSPQFPSDQIGQSEGTVLQYEGSEVKSMRIMRIKESLSDICRVMEDCGDATK